MSVYMCVSVYIKQVCEYQEQSLFKGNQFVPSLKGSASVGTLSAILPHYTHWWTAVTTAVTSPSAGPINRCTTHGLNTDCLLYQSKLLYLISGFSLCIWTLTKEQKDMIIHDWHLAFVQKQIHKLCNNTKKDLKLIKWIDFWGRSLKKVSGNTNHRYRSFVVWLTLRT